MAGVGMITQDRLKDILSYDALTGKFRWRFKKRGRRAGSLAGGVRPDGYVRINVDGSLQYAHRLAWLWVTGECPTVIDHINRDPSDNRIANLRAATHSQNLRNQGIGRRNTSGFKGVSYFSARGKWRAYLSVNGKFTSLGLFKTATEAHEAHAAAEKSHFGEFAP
jgi:hypothetical protein